MYKFRSFLNLRVFNDNVLCLLFSHALFKCIRVLRRNICMLCYMGNSTNILFNEAYETESGTKNFEFLIYPHEGARIILGARLATYLNALKLMSVNGF